MTSPKKKSRLRGTEVLIFKPLCLTCLERSEGLLKHYLFKTPTVLYHDGGHYLPSNAASRQAYKAFVQGFV